MSAHGPTRRNFLERLGFLIILPALSLRSRAGSPEPDFLPSRSGGSRFLTRDEIDFFDAASARLIPADPLGPGAKEAGASAFMDAQLSGAYGRAQRWYMRGPWHRGTEQQGYQSRLTPAELYRAVIRELDDYCRKTFGNRKFAQLGVQEQDEVLKKLESGKIELREISAKSFFSMLLQNSQEAFFSDPIYGGNRQFAGWKLIGFPGPRYDYSQWVERYGQRYPLPPVSIAGRTPGGMP